MDVKLLVSQFRLRSNFFYQYNICKLTVASQIFWEQFWQPKHCRYFTTFIRAVHQVFSAVGFRYFAIHLLITNQNLFFLFVILSSSGRVCFVCSDSLSWFSVLSCHFHCFIAFSSSLHEHVCFQLERIFFSKFFSLSAMHHRRTITGQVWAPCYRHGHRWGPWECHELRWLALESQYGHVQAQIPSRIGFTTIARKCCFESFANFCRKIFE